MGTDNAQGFPEDHRHLQGEQGVPKAEVIREGKPSCLEEPMGRVCTLASLNRGMGHYPAVCRQSKPGGHDLRKLPCKSLAENCSLQKRERERERDPLRRHIQPISIKSGRRGQEAGMGMWKVQKP